MQKRSPSARDVCRRQFGAPRRTATALSACALQVGACVQPTCTKGRPTWPCCAKTMKIFFSAIPQSLSQQSLLQRRHTLRQVAEAGGAGQAVSHPCLRALGWDNEVWTCLQARMQARLHLRPSRPPMVPRRMMLPAGASASQICREELTAKTYSIYAASTVTPWQ
jgi:hypothetical protein